MSIKIFDLLPIVQKLENLKLSHIESFHYSNTVLCLGTNDGYLLRYSINQSNYLGENIGFKSELIDFKLLNQKKPINLITIVSELQLIIFLSDGSLSSLNFDNLKLSTNNTVRIKNVTTYCFNEKFKPGTNNFGMEMSMLCVCIRGRILQLFTIEENEAKFYKGIFLQTGVKINFLRIQWT